MWRSLKHSHVLATGFYLGSQCTSTEETYYTPPSSTSKIKIFTGNANRALANEVALHLGTQVGRMTVAEFTDGETSVKVHDSIRGEKCYIIQPTCAPVNKHVIELLLMITTLRRASAKQITAVIPYYGYGRSTETYGKTRPIAGADVAIMLEVAGVDRVVSIDLHRGQAQGFFAPTIPVDNLDASRIAMPYLQTKFLHNPVVMAPDANGTARAKAFADNMRKYGIDATFAMIVDQKYESDDEKREGKLQKYNSMRARKYQLIGDVHGRDVVIVDDMIDTATRMERTAKIAKKNGAARVFAYASHGVFTGNALDRIEKSSIIECLVLNTIPMKELNSTVQQLSVGALLAETIRNIHCSKPVSVLM